MEVLEHYQVDYEGDLILWVLPILMQNIALKLPSSLFDLFMEKLEQIQEDLLREILLEHFLFHLLKSLEDINCLYVQLKIV